MKKMDSQKGFTLMETLITLALLGVIAAIVAPSFMGNTAEKILRTQIKNVNKEIAQGLTELQAKTTSGDPWAFAAAPATAQNMADAFRKNMPGAGAVSATPGITGYYADGTTAFALPANSRGFTSQTGAIITFNSTIAASTACNTATPCAQIIADVNGATAPNKAGTDIHVWYVYKDTDATGDNVYTLAASGSTVSGATCATTGANLAATENCTFVKLTQK